MTLVGIVLHDLNYIFAVFNIVLEYLEYENKLMN